MIDIHSHILPGLDDGAGDWEQSCEMLKIAHEQGIKKIIATPHFMPGRRNASPETIRNKAKRLQAYIEEQGYDMQVYTGNEIYYNGDVTEKLECGSVLTLADSSFILLEFSPMDDYRYIYNSLAELVSEGYRPILAHAERYEAISRDIKSRVEDLKKMGVLIQINASSVEGKHGRQEKKTIKELLKNQLVDFIGTDAHGTLSRAPYIEKCVKQLSKKCTSEYKEAILYRNAEKILLEK